MRQDWVLKKEGKRSRVSSWIWDCSKESTCQGRRHKRSPVLGQEDPLEKEMATHSCIFAWRIPWTEEPGRLQSIGCKELDTTQHTHTHTHTHKHTHTHTHVCLNAEVWAQCCSICRELSSPAGDQGGPASK